MLKVFLRGRGAPSQAVRVLLSILLSLSLILSFPFSSYASDYSANDAYLLASFIDGNDNFSTQQSQGALPIGFSYNKNSTYFKSLVFNQYFTCADFKKGDRVTLTLELATNFSLSASLNSSYNKNGILLDISQTTGNVADIVGFQYSTTGGVPKFIVVFNCNKDINKGYYSFSCTVNALSVSNPTNFYIVSSSYSVESEEKGMLSSILSWLSNIKSKLDDTFQSIGNGFTNIGNWFSNLQQDLIDLFADVGDWFSNLGNNINTWLTNVKNAIVNKVQEISTWLSNLGDRIGNFFTNIWTNISNMWESFKTWLHDLFIPSDEFMASYKNQWSLWLEQHFGGVFDASNCLIELLNNVGDLLNFTQLNSFTVNIPETNLNLSQFHFYQRIIPETQFEFNYNFAPFSQFRTMSNMAINALFFLWGVYQIKELWLEFIDKRSAEL